MITLVDGMNLEHESSRQRGGYCHSAWAFRSILQCIAETLCMCMEFISCVRLAECAVLPGILKESCIAAEAAVMGP